MLKTVYKNIKKILFFSILFCITFITNFQKVEAQVIKCNYKLPYSSYYLQKGKFTRQAPNYYTIETSFKLDKSEKRSGKFFIEKIKIQTLNSNSGDTKLYLISDSKLETCPKYIKISLGNVLGSQVKTYSSSSDENYKSNLKKFYGIAKIKSSDKESDDSYTFLPKKLHKNYATFPGIGQKSNIIIAEDLYLPLYSYEDNVSGEVVTCLLSENVGHRGGNGSSLNACSVSYDGIDPAQYYIDTYITEYYQKAYQPLFQSVKNNCNNYTVLNRAYRNVTGEQTSQGTEENYECWKSAVTYAELAFAYNNFTSAFSSASAGTLSSYWDDYLNNSSSINSTLYGYFQEMNDMLNINALNQTDMSAFNAFIREREANSNLSEARNNVFNNMCAVLEDETERNRCEAQYNVCNLDTTHVFQQSIEECMINNGWQSVIDQNTQNVSEATQEASAARAAAEAQRQLVNSSPVIPRLVINRGDYTASCDDVKVFRVIWLIIEIGAPIITIGLGIFDFTKAIIAGDDSKISKAKQAFYRRIVALLIFILLPIIIHTLISLLDESSVNIDLAKCIIKWQ